MVIIVNVYKRMQEMIGCCELHSWSSICFTPTVWKESTLIVNFNNIAFIQFHVVLNTFFLLWQFNITFNIIYVGTYTLTHATAANQKVFVYVKLHVLHRLHITTLTVGDTLPAYATVYVSFIEPIIIIFNIKCTKSNYTDLFILNIL